MADGNRRHAQKQQTKLTSKEDEKKDPEWKLTQEQLNKELQQWKPGPIQNPALLTEDDIWKDFRAKDKSGWAQNFIGGGTKLLSQLACHQGPIELLETVQDLIKEKFIDKAASRVMGYGLRRTEGKEWDKNKDRDPSGMLIKKLSTSTIVFGILVATGTGLATAGIGLGVGAVFAVFAYLGAKDRWKEDNMKKEIATHMIETYQEISAGSLERIRAKRQKEVEQVLLSNAKHDWEDDNPQVVAWTYSYSKRSISPITRTDISRLIYFYPEVFQLALIRQAELWAGFQGPIESAWKRTDMSIGTDDRHRIIDATKAALVEQNSEKEAQVTEGIPPCEPSLTEHSINSGQVLFKIQRYLRRTHRFF